MSCDRSDTGYPAAVPETHKHVFKLGNIEVATETRQPFYKGCIKNIFEHAKIQNKKKLKPFPVADLTLVLLVISAMNSSQMQTQGALSCKLLAANLALAFYNVVY